MDGVGWFVVFGSGRFGRGTDKSGPDDLGVSKSTRSGGLPSDGGLHGSHELLGVL